MRIFLAVLYFMTGALYAKTVYFLHIGGIDSSKYFYDYTYYRDEVSKPSVLLREAVEKAGFNVQFTEDASGLEDVAAIISFNDVRESLLFNLCNYPIEKCFLLVTEPPIVLPDVHAARTSYFFGKIFNLFDDPIDNKKYFKLYYPQPRLEMMEDIPSFSERRLCTMISGNKNFGESRSLYPERRKVISFFTTYCDEFDLYGPDWNGYVAWRGYVASKWGTLKNYKFNFCYENLSNQRGYITEKIFDPMIAGSIPIYLGADNITDYIPAECFIDRRNFASEADLYCFMKNIDEDTYNSYLKAIKNFLASPAAHKFSIDYFVETILTGILSVNKN